MIDFIQKLSDHIEVCYPSFEGRGRIICDRESFKKYGITDKEKNGFYIRLKNLDSMDDFSIKKSGSLKTIDSSWTAIFQIEKEADHSDIMKLLVMAACNYSECISNVTYTCSTDKIYKDECKNKTKEDGDGAIRYPFNLVRIAFELKEETTVDFCIESCVKI